MKHHRVLVATAVLPLLIAACGSDDSATPATEPPPPETLPPVSPGEGFDYPTGAEDVVLRIGFEGGFVTPEMAFSELPQVLVTGDGRVFQQGPVIAIYPGPLLPNIQVRSITPEGIQELLELAESSGMLTEREYEAPQFIADAPDTVAQITVDGTTYEHRAYALGLGGGPVDEGTDEDADRAAFESFVVAVQEFVVAPAGDVLGDEEPFEPAEFRIRALVVGDGGEYDVEPTVVDWPENAPVSLSDEIDCAIVPADALAAPFADANQLTWFAEDGITYQVIPVPVLPGDRGC